MGQGWEPLIPSSSFEKVHVLKSRFPHAEKKTNHHHQKPEQQRCCPELPNLVSASAAGGQMSQDLQSAGTSIPFLQLQMVQTQPLVVICLLSDS